MSIAYHLQLEGSDRGGRDARGSRESALARCARLAVLFGFWPYLLDEGGQCGDLRWPAGEVKTCQCREHWRRVIAPDLVGRRVHQAVAHEPFVDQHAPTAAQGHAVTGEARKIRRGAWRPRVQMTHRAAITYHQPGSLRDELLLMGEWFGHICGRGSLRRAADIGGAARPARGEYEREDPGERDRRRPPGGVWV
jgi:hypothetical protein